MSACGPGIPVFVPDPAPGLGYGGAEYGYSSYGSPSSVRPPYPVDGGRGGYAYGFHSYGSVDIEPPRVSSAASIDGYSIEIFFSEPMEINADLEDPLSYTLTTIIGAPSIVLAVEVGVEEDCGATSVIITHTGTTLGGKYTVTVAATLKDLNGNPILSTGRATTFLTLGATPTYTVTPTDGSHLLLDFSEDMLPESGFSPGIEALSAYEFESTYPVPLSLTGINHPFSGNDDQVRLTVSGMTSATYTLTVGPAEAFDYDGSVLPSAATEFTGVAVGTGTSTASPGSKLLLSKAAGVLYGWEFQDTSGRVLPSSSFRIDLVFNAAAAIIAPPVGGTAIAALAVSDGTVQVLVNLLRPAGVDAVEVISGAFNVQVPATWSSGTTTITLLRNQKADHYAVLVNGVPWVSEPTSSFTGIPTIAPGARFTLGIPYAVTQFRVQSLGFTSTQTVFSGSWNFLHGVTQVFIGSSALTRPSFLTERGPLVKSWGDPTPATEADVEVRVNSIPVSIESVNPYIGLITPTIPIPLTTPGSTTVEVGYIWFPNPAFPMVGLNTLGLVLNKWDLHQGHHHPSVSPLPVGHLGVPDRMRFPMGIVLAPLLRQRPILISHRYIGFERGYTASLNSPTTLLLNQNPHSIARDTLSDSPQNVEVSYEGDVTPITAELPWILEGADSGFVGLGADTGFYFLVDASAGSYDLGTAAFYKRDEDFGFPASLNMAARIQAIEWTLDGIFSGLGFGAHNNKYLYLVGLLEINGIHHVGLIRDATKPHLRSSWVLGPSLSITITSATTFEVSSSAFGTTSIRAEDLVLQILEGSQTGIYHVAECGIEIDGDTVTVTLDPTTPFPEDPTLYGNNIATAYVEIRWDLAPITFRLVADVDKGSAQVYIGGTLGGLAISAANVAAYPAQTTLLLPTTEEGAVFWGSVSRVSTNTSKWGFVRYGVTYDMATFHFQGIVVAAEMSDTPDEDANHQWFITEDFGYGVIDFSGDTLLLKSTANDSSIDTTFGYGRLEPFLTTQVLTDVDATFRLDSGILGAGDAQITIQDGNRFVLFSTILYREGGTPFRRLVSLPSVSLTGLRDPETEGWAKAGSATVSVHEKVVTIEQGLGQDILYSKALILNSDSSNGRIFEARFAVTAHSALSAGEGPTFGGRVGPTVGPNGKDVALTLTTSPEEVVLTSNGMAILSFAFAWDDGQNHTYRVITDPTVAAVSLVVDDQVLGVAPLGSFTAAPTDTLTYFGASGGTSTVEWDSFSTVVTPLPVVKRTLGVYRGGDKSSIESWELPRTDSTTAPNSSPAAVVEEMDWRSDTQVRVRLDPNWGATVFRPDLPPPPYYTGDFATAFTEPSAGWINIEYRLLPRANRGFGRVTFGALDPQSITQQRWGEVRYRIYTRADENFIAPQHMVLNWFNVITSGELNRDTTVEVLEVESLTSILVSLAPTHIYADRVFNIIVGSLVLDSTSWTFDKDSQSITLNNPLPSEHTLVTVSFAAGKPITNTYLCTQPLLQGVTLLNEGTPPVPKSQVGTATRVEVFGSQLNDPTDTLGDIDFILNDPFRSVSFEDPEGTLYEQLDFCEVTDAESTGLLSIACDGPSPEEGWIEMALSGTSFSDAFSGEGGVAVWGGPVVARDTVGGFNQSSILLASGGSLVTGGNLGPGTAILYPSYPAIPGPDRGAVIRSLTMNLSLSAVLTDTDPLTEQDLIEDLDFANTASDNTPPTYVGDVDPNPDGTPGVFLHGAAVAELVDYVSTTYSRLGPWGGETALAVRSQLYGASGAQPTGIPASGMGLVLMGGVALGPDPTTSTFGIEAAN